MGKKGKMSAFDSKDGGQGKWCSSDLHRNLDYYVAKARREAYDHSLIDRRKRAIELSNRKRFNFSHLRYLVEERLNEDVLNPNPIVLPGKLALPVSEFRSLRSLQEKQSSRDDFLSAICDALSTDLFTEKGSLFDLCVDVTARNFNRYDKEDLEYVVGTLTSDYCDLLFIKAVMFGTLNRSHLQILVHGCGSVIAFGGDTTDEDIKDLINAFCMEFKKAGKDVDSWESLDFNCVNFSNHTLRIRSLCLTNLEASFEVFTELFETFCYATCVSLHDFKLKARSSADLIDGTATCLNVLSILCDRCKMISSINLSCCDWLTTAALTLFSSRIRCYREKGCCLSLLELKIRFDGCCDQAKDSQVQHERHALVALFREQCNIELICN